MGRHLSRILLNKVLIQLHVAPFQTKPGTQAPRNTPIYPPSPPTHPNRHNRGRGDPTSRWCYPLRLGGYATPHDIYWICAHPPLHTHTHTLKPPQAEMKPSVQQMQANQRGPARLTGFCDMWVTPHSEIRSSLGCNQQVQSLRTQTLTWTLEAIVCSQTQRVWALLPKINRNWKEKPGKGWKVLPDLYRCSLIVLILRSRRMRQLRPAPSIPSLTSQQSSPKSHS